MNLATSQSRKSLPVIVLYIQQDVQNIEATLLCHFTSFVAALNEIIVIKLENPNGESQGLLQTGVLMCCLYV